MNVINKSNQSHFNYHNDLIGYCANITYTIVCNTNKKQIEDIISIILIECGMKAFGYNNYNNEYWAKNNHQLYFTFIINNNSKTQIKIKNIKDPNNIIDEICIKITKLINMYETILDKN